MGYDLTMLLPLPPWYEPNTPFPTKCSVFLIELLLQIFWSMQTAIIYLLSLSIPAFLSNISESNTQQIPTVATLASTHKPPC